ncbi:hypothetical protein GDO86_006639 [Hymenochirus boettgeri]|uniref:Saposin A-type domain-containing protein n=1 Tax=Hymenochirus boettgeri TaxID=247094 RepID=A0A8T2JBU3_9PIPI|nr:hypothetical protein GDO86_006639 [Hymenochirus boettgeri]
MVKKSSLQNENGEWPLPLPLCWMCKSFVGRIESLIPKTALAHSASQLCRLLPAKIAGVCQCLVEKYTIIILDMILNKLGPQLLCRLVFMCSTNENCEADLPVIPSLDSDLSCDTCLVVTSWIKPTLSYNMTHAEVEAAMRRAHNETALQWNGGQTFLQKHHSELSVILHKQWDQMKTCQALGACQTLVNASPENSGCAAGPSYWCQNLETAKKCEAVDHCLKYMWH